MMNYQCVARHALVLVLAVTMNACLQDPERNGSQYAGINLSITIPSNAPTLDTQDTGVSIAGTASSDMGITTVSWANNRGGGGVAIGTGSWQVKGIDLALGLNIITITAEDTSGARIKQSVIVNRESGHWVGYSILDSANHTHRRLYFD